MLYLQPYFITLFITALFIFTILTKLLILLYKMSTYLGKTHKKSFFLVVETIRFYPPYPYGLVVHATKKRFFYVCLPLLFKLKMGQILKQLLLLKSRINDVLSTQIHRVKMYK